jgi:hypothetical protein
MDAGKGAFLIGTETELVLKSRWVTPAGLSRKDSDLSIKKLKRH